MSITLTVFFDAPFWVGVFERQEGSRLYAAKVVFGAEPSEQQVYDMVLQQFEGLPFSPPVEVVKRAKLASNPKRRQRQAMQSVTKTPGTKAQQAMQLAREEMKEACKTRSKEKREAEEERKFLLGQAKKKAKHRGH